MTDDIRGTISARERHYCELAKSLNYEEERAANGYLKRVEKLSRRISNSKEHPFRLSKDRFGRKALVLSPLGIELKTCMKNFDPNYRLAYENHCFGPYLSVIYRLIDRCQEISSCFDLCNGRYIGGSRARTLVRRMVSFLRRVFGSKWFKARVKNYPRNAADNFKSCREYVIELFRGKSRLLIVRVDIYFRPGALDFIKPGEANRAIEKFIRALREGRITPGIEGWIVKREPGFHRGTHLHAFAAINGHDHRAGATIAQTLGEYWVKECVRSDWLGSYYNCFARRDQYEYDGLGLVHYTNRYKLMGICEALRYITKEEMKLKTKSGGKRNFRRGQMPKPTSRGGAPRMSGDDLTVVKEVLGF